MTYEQALIELVPLSIHGKPILPKRNKHGNYRWIRHGLGSFDKIIETLGFGRVSQGLVSCTSALMIHEDDMGPLLKRYEELHSYYIQRAVG